MDEFMQLLEEHDFMIKRGKYLSFKHRDFKKFIRMDSLGEGYTEADIETIMLGKKQPVQRKRRDIPAPEKDHLLIDIEAKLRDGKGKGYERWAKVFNLKQMVQTINYLREHNLLNMDELQRKTSDVTAYYHELSDKIKSAEAQIKEIN